ncbi:WGxxGxxG family protein [Paenibacillus sp. strain BS8-2]
MLAKWLLRLSIPLVVLMTASHVYAYAGTDNGGNGGLGGGMGTNRSVVNEGITTKSYDSRMDKMDHSSNVSVYGTGTGSQFLNVNTDTPRAIGNIPQYQMDSYTGNDFHAASTTSTKTTNWSWLGLIGLLGLFGFRSRNPERNN